MRSRLCATIAATALALAAILFATLAASPVRATPDEQRACNAGGCHSGAASGSVTAKASRTTLTPRATYTVTIAINLSAKGDTGYWIATSTASGTTGTSTGVFAGPGSQKTWKVTLEAPARKGTYSYKVFGVRGAPPLGQTATATYHVTVR